MSDKADSFQCGSFEVARKADPAQLAEKLNRLRQAVDMCRLQPGVGYTINRSTNGTTISIQGQGTGVSAENNHPFKIKTKKEDKKHKFFVGYGEFGGTDAGGNKIQIADMEAWIEFDPPANIYLEAVFTTDDDAIIASASIKSISNDTPLDPVEISDGRQTKAFITLGMYIDADEQKKTYRLIQNVFSNLGTRTVCYNGYAAVILSPD